MSMEKSNETIWNQTHALPLCNVLPQPAALPCAICTLCGLGDLKYEMLIDDKSSEFKSFFPPTNLFIYHNCHDFNIKLFSLQDYLLASD